MSVLGPIAILGMACRFPGAADLEAFRRLLWEGRSATGPPVDGRWDSEAYRDPDPEAPGKLPTLAGGYLSNVDGFDPGFFRISPREAAWIDPQQRLILETAWHALEHAGVRADRLAGTRTGVCVGISSMDYMVLSALQPPFRDPYLPTGNAHSLAANRLSYFLDLRGPSFAVDTACSSSLVALHLACQQLRLGECDLALAGGVNALLHPVTMVGFAKARMLGSADRSRPFDADSDGYLRAEGAGVVVLKRLEDARRDGDPILAVILGSAVNQDGRTAGIAQPRQEAQEAVIREALRSAGVAPAWIDYVEAHGTGTPVGDPIEIRALDAVLREGRTEDDVCLIGSVKSNLGHLEAAAGIAGLIKTVLALRHEEIPPHLHLERLNPELALDDSPLLIAGGHVPFPSGGERPRYAGVSSFGFGGTNAHVVLSEAPAPEPGGTGAQDPFDHTDPTDPSERFTVAAPARHLLPLSAQSEGSLRALAATYRDLLTGAGEAPLGDLCASVRAGRAPLSHRLAVVAETADAAVSALDAHLEGRRAPAVHLGGRPRRAPAVAFLFPGQGCQYPGMGRELYEREPVFRRALDHCAELLRPWLEVPLLGALFSEPGAAVDLDRTAVAQPALFAFEYALDRLWRSWGIEPDALVGHSLGEYAAACAAGVYPLAEALRVVAGRGTLLERLEVSGGMAAVQLEEEPLLARLARYDGRLEIAAYNAPAVHVISGDREPLDAFLAECERDRIPAHNLGAARAFHSRHVEAVLPELEALEATLSSSEPDRLFLGSRTAAPMTRETLTAGYWARSAREGVRFRQCVEELLQRGFQTFVEIGPGSALIPLVRRCALPAEGIALPSLAPPDRSGRPRDLATLLPALAELWVRQAPVDWEAFDHRREGARPLPPERRVELPLYPFDRQPCWLPQDVRPYPFHPRELAPATPPPAAAPRWLHPLLERRAGTGEPAVFETQLDAGAEPLLRDHCIRGRHLLPGAALFEMLLAAARLAAGEPLTVLEECDLLTPLEVTPEVPRVARAAVTPRVTGDERAWVCTLTSAPAPVISEGPPVRLELGESALLDTLAMRPFEPRELAPDEVQVEVHAAGLNFMDVMKALGLYPGLPPGPVALGGEFAGVVRAVGAGVEDLHPGDPVLGMALGSFASRVIAPRGLVWCKPERLSFAEAAGLPVAFVTAAYALEDLARIGPGERVLIHSASGGVGLAAIQLAHAAGATVYATAGSEERREFLRAQGVAAVFDSRGLEFAAQVREATGGEGVDVVLNSLTGDAMLASLDLLREGGRFLEIGRTAIYQDTSVGLAPFRRNLSYFAVDMNLACRTHPHQVRHALEGVLLRIEGGELSPLPAELFPLEQAETAFRRMAQRRHLGKLVLVPSHRIETLHARAVARLAPDAPAPIAAETLDLPTLRERCALPLAVADVTARLHTVGIESGPCLQSLQGVRAGEREVLARLHAPPEPRAGFLLPPALLDGALQALAVLEASGGDPEDLGALYLPAGFDQLEWLGPLSEPLVAYATLRESDASTSRRTRVVNLDLAAPNGTRLLRIHGLRLQRADLPAAPGWENAALPTPIERCLYQTVRIPTPRGEPAERPPALWLLLAHSGGVGDALAEQLAARGDRCVRVLPGEEFARLADGGYRLDPGDAEGYARLLRELGEQGITPDGLLHLWTLDPACGEAGSLDALERSQALGPDSLLFLTQALAAACPGDLTGWLVTRDAETTGAALWGAGKVISREYERFRVFGLGLDPGLTDPAELAQTLVAEINAAPGAPGFGRWITLRDGERLTASVARLELGEAAMSVGSVGSGRPDRSDWLPHPLTLSTSVPSHPPHPAVYLVTGGQSGIGRELARAIAERGPARFVLLNRTPLSAATHPERAAGIRALEAQGAEVWPAVGDVGDLDAMRALVAEIRERWGALNGIIHAAGALEPALVARIDRRHLELIRQARVRGTWVLDSVTRDQPPDLMVLCSSLASLAAPPGLAAYVAANSFQDAFAERRSREGLRTVSIQWGSWSETGLATGAGTQAALRGRGVEPLSNADGRRGFELALAQGLPVVGVFRLEVGLTPARLLSPLRLPSRTRSGQLRGLRTKVPPPPSDASDATLQAWLLHALARELAASLHLPEEQISPEASVLELGLDSLMAVETVANLRRDYDLPVEPALLFEYPTLADLSAFLVTQHGEALRSLCGEEPSRGKT